MTFEDLYGDELDKVLGSSDRTNLFTTAKRKKETNRAMQWFITETACCQKRGEFPLVDGVAEYNLLDEIGADFLFWTPTDVEVWGTNTNTTPDEITYYAGPDLPRYTENALNALDPGWRSTTPSTPLGWYDRNSAGQYILGIYPAVEIESGWTWKAITPYTVKATEMTANADQPFTVDSSTYTNLTPWHDAIALKAGSELEMLRKGVERSQYLLQQAMARVVDFRDKTRVPQSRRMQFQKNYLADAQQWNGGYYQGYRWGRVCP